MKNLYLLLSLTLLSFVVYSQQPTSPQPEVFKPSGSPIVTVFSDFRSSVGNVDYSGFEISRAYLGYKYDFSENVSARVIGNFADIGAAKYSQVGYLQYADLIYTNDTKNITAKFGLIQNRQFDVQENFWGHRYVLQSLQDYRFGIASADRGATVQYTINKIISVDALIRNGEGYKLIQGDNTYRGGIGLTLNNPIQNLLIRGYFDCSEKPVATQNSIATFAGYTFKKDETKNLATIGVEYNMYNNVGYVKHKDIIGISVYGSLNITQKIELFARYDFVQSNKLSGTVADWNIAGALDAFPAGTGYFKSTSGGLIADGSTVVGGIQYALVNGVKLALDYQTTNYVSSTKAKPLNLVYLNVEYTF